MLCLTCEISGLVVFLHIFIWVLAENCIHLRMPIIVRALPFSSRSFRILALQGDDQSSISTLEVNFSIKLSFIIFLARIPGKDLWMVFGQQSIMGYSFVLQRSRVVTLSIAQANALSAFSKECKAAPNDQIRKRSLPIHWEIERCKSSLTYSSLLKTFYCIPFWFFVSLKILQDLGGPHTLSFLCSAIWPSRENLSEDSPYPAQCS